MSVRYWWISLVLALAAMPAHAQPAMTQAGQPAPRAAQDWFYLPGPADVVAGAVVTPAKWSPDGRYALAVRQRITLRSMDDFKMEPSIVLWNAETKASTVVWRVDSMDYHIQDVVWMHGASVALATIAVNSSDGHRSTIWRIDARRATAAQVSTPRPRGEGWMDQGVSVSPRLPWAVISGNDDQGDYLIAMGADGRLSRAIRPEGVLPLVLRWSKDGATAYLQGHRKGEPGAEPGPMPWVTFRPETLEIGFTPTEPERAEPDPPRPLPFTLEESTINLAVAGKVSAPNTPAATTAPPAAIGPWGESKVKSLWLVQGEGKATERTLLAADAESHEVSPRGDAVLYTNREGCFVVPLIRLDRAQVAAARQAAQLSMLLNNGKQVALAVIMYAIDNDDTLPSAGTDLRTLLEPYTKTTDIFNGLSGPGDGFVYTFGGGPMSSVENPAEAEMGYIPAPGGRAVVYVDGHVKFVPFGKETPPPAGGPAERLH